MISRLRTPVFGFYIGPTYLYVVPKPYTNSLNSEQHQARPGALNAMFKLSGSTVLSLETAMGGFQNYGPFFGYPKY